MALLVACLVGLAGLGLALAAVPPAESVAAEPLPWMLLALPSLVAAAVARAYPVRLLALAAALLLLGWARGLSALPVLADNPLQPYYGQVTLHGDVAAPATPTETGITLRLAATSVQRAGEGEEATANAAEPAGGIVLVRLPRTAAYDYGDALMVRGLLRPPPDSPASGYGAALWRQGVRGAMDYPEVVAAGAANTPQPRAALHALRRRLEAGIAAALPEPHAGLLVGITLGGSATLPADFREAMRSAGLSHLLAVSGFNVTLVAAALTALATATIGRRAGWPVAAAGVLLYTLLVGAPPSAVRAAVMALVAIGAVALGRPRDGLAALAATAVLLAAWDPLLLGDLGFQLSVLATSGLIVLQPLLRARLHRLPTWAAEGLAATLAAQAFVLPLQVATFHTVSLVAPLANVLVVPLVAPLMALGIIVGLVSLVAPGLAALLAIAPWACLELVIRVVQAIATLPGARTDTGALPPLLGAAYVAALVLLVLAAVPETSPLRAALARTLTGPLPRAAALALVLVLSLGALALAGRPDPRLQVAVLDVGQGDATLVRTPSGRLLLVDGGPNPATLLAHLGSRLGLAERHLHVVALTHPHEDHVAGLVEVVNRFSVGQVVEGAVDYPSSGADRWRALLRDRAVPTITGAIGQQWQLDDDVVLDVWAIPPLPGSRADRLEPPGALVLRLRYGATSLLLPGDLVAEQAHRLRAAGHDLRATALLVPHHGSRTGLDADLLRAIGPSVAVVSNGDRNRFGHPAPQTLALLDAHTIPVWRTDRDGTIELASDGAAWTVQPTGKGR